MQGKVGRGEGGGDERKFQDQTEMVFERRARRYLRKHPLVRWAVMGLAVAVLAAEVGMALGRGRLSPGGAVVALFALWLLLWASRAGTY
jgi:hypothetical protein